MPFVSIRIVGERLAPDPAGKKRAIAAKVAGAIAEATGLPQTDISIVFDDVAARDWYVGSVDVETRLRKSKDS